MKEQTMKSGWSIGVCVLIAVAANAQTAPRELPLRWERGTCIHGASTSQTVEATYGTSLMAMAFSGTKTYDFYSPPLSATTTLTTKDKGGGTIFMNNASPSHANDFAFTGRMQFYDYDPATGHEALIVDTGNSSAKNVNRGQSVNWPLANVSISATTTVPAGHILHVAVILTLVSGNPGSYGQLMYNGPKGTTTVAYLSENNVASWTFSDPVLPCQSTSGICFSADGCARVSCAGFPNQNYLVQATDSLTPAQWVTIGTNAAGADGAFTYVDLDAPNHPVRFYRTAAP